MSDQKPRSLESTVVLLDRLRAGDESAREHLLARYLPILRRWAHGRLPARARDLSDTDDLVQVTLIRALSHLDRFEVRREGAFLAYLRTVLLNALRDELRRASRSPDHGVPLESVADLLPSPVEAAVGRETLEMYEEALSKLGEDQREAVILRVEFGYTYGEIADAMGKPSTNAARMVVVRALEKVVEGMNEHRP